jgi:hypothetical protein
MLSKPGERVMEWYALVDLRDYSLEDLFRSATWAKSNVSGRIQKDSLIRVRSTCGLLDCMLRCASKTGGRMKLELWPVIPAEVFAAQAAAGIKRHEPFKTRTNKASSAAPATGEQRSPYRKPIEITESGFSIRKFMLEIPEDMIATVHEPAAWAAGWSTTLRPGDLMRLVCDAAGYDAMWVCHSVMPGSGCMMEPFLERCRAGTPMGNALRQAEMVVDAEERVKLQMQAGITPNAGAA